MHKKMADPARARAVRIVLVNWNGWRDTVECLESVFRLCYAPEALQVIVCDNDSSDSSLERIARWADGVAVAEPVEGPLHHLSAPPVTKPIAYAFVDADMQQAPAVPLLLVRTGGNLGFAGGNNVGIRLAMRDRATDFIWLLNNDTVVQSDSLALMVEKACSAPGIGVVGSVNCFYSSPEIVQALGGGMFSRWRGTGRLYGSRIRLDQIAPAARAEAENELQWVSGASMLVSRAFIEQVGLMEESYFLYFEEIDWAIRSRRRFSNALAYEARIYHKGGSSTGEQQDSHFASYTQCRSRIKLYRNHMPMLLGFCYFSILKATLSALLKGRMVLAKALAFAARDELLGR